MPTPGLAGSRKIRCNPGAESSDKGDSSYRYTVYFEPQTDGSFAVVFPAFPEIVTRGGTLDEARAMARDALRCHLEGLRKEGARRCLDSGCHNYREG